MYRSSENYYQAQKAVNIADKFELSKVYPAESKKLARHIEIRKDWEKIKLAVMLEAVRIKFNYVPVLGEQLLLTGDRDLIEVNTWGDTFWGVCNNVGENHLGKILMQVRKEIRENTEERKAFLKGKINDYKRALGQDSKRGSF